LGDPLGADEARHLDLVDAGGREEVDEPGLVGRWDVSGLVLEPVARGDIGDADMVGHGRMVRDRDQR